MASGCAANGAFGALTIVLRVFCVIPFLTGAADLFGGVKFLQTAGATVSGSERVDPILNNQIKFWGAIWFGYGLSLWWASYDVRGRSTLVRILLATLFLSGLGRALSVYEFGWASVVLTGAMALELIGAPALVLWHGWLLRRP